MSDPNLKTAVGDWVPVSKDLGPVTLEQRVSAAAFIAVLGAEKAGVTPKAKMLYPLQAVSNIWANAEAATFIADILTALLEELPLQRRVSLQQQLEDRLISDFEHLPRSGKNEAR